MATPEENLSQPAVDSSAVDGSAHVGMQAWSRADMLGNHLAKLPIGFIYTLVIFLFLCYILYFY